MFSSAELQAALDAGRAPELALEERELAPLVAWLAAVRRLEDACLASMRDQMPHIANQIAAAARSKAAGAPEAGSEPTAAAPPSSDLADAPASGRTEPEAPLIVKLQLEVSVPVTLSTEILRQLEPSASAPPAAAPPAGSPPAKKSAHEGHVRMNLASIKPKRSPARPSGEPQKEAAAQPEAFARTLGRQRRGHHLGGQKTAQWRVEVKAAREEKAAAVAEEAAAAAAPRPPALNKPPAVLPPSQAQRHKVIAFWGGMSLTDADKSLVQFNFPGAVKIRHFGSVKDKGDGEFHRLCSSLKRGSLDLVIVGTDFNGHSGQEHVRRLCKNRGAEFLPFKALKSPGVVDSAGGVSG